MPLLTAAFEQFADAARVVRTDSASGVLTVSVGIRYGQATQPGLLARRLFPEACYLVCPARARGAAEGDGLPGADTGAAGPG